jgi:hypothetical protein
MLQQWRAERMWRRILYRAIWFALIIAAFAIVLALLFRS